MKKFLNSQKNSFQGGQFMVLALIFIGLMLANALLLVDRSNLFFSNSAMSLEDVQALNLAESGLDKAVSRLNSATGSEYNGESFALGKGTVEVSIAAIPGSTFGKRVTAKVSIPGTINPRLTRIITADIDKVTSISVPYAIFAGDDGVYLGNNSQVTNNGSVFSNGPVIMGANAKIEGDLVVSGGTTQYPEIEQTNCDYSPYATCSNFIYNISNNTYAAGQSFIPGISGQLTKAAVQVRKIGSNATNGMILTLNGNINSGGRDIPNSAAELGKGLAVPGNLYSIPVGHLAQNHYAWIEIIFNPPINLTAGTKYWLTSDSQSFISETNYLEMRYIQQGGITPTPSPTNTPTPSPTPTTPAPTPTISPNTFGYTSIGGSNNSGATNTMNGTRFTTGASAGQTQSMTVYFGTIDSNTSKRSFQMAIYTNITGNNPGTLVASSSIGTAVLSSWVTVPINANLTPSTQYWLFFNSNGDNNMRYTSGTSGQSGYKTQTYGTWPGSFGAITKENIKFSIYATFGVPITPTVTPTPTPTLVPTPTNTPAPTPTPAQSYGYSGGIGSYSNSSGNWLDLGGDFLFKLYITPSSGSAASGPKYAEGVIYGSGGANVGRDLYANTIKNMIVNNRAFYQDNQSIDLFSKVSGFICFNSNCKPNSTDIVAQPLPITDEMVQAWRDEAFAGGVYNGDITSCPSSPWGPKQINGNVTLSGCSALVIRSPIYITGTLTIQNNNQIELDDSFGKTTGVILADNKVTVGSTNQITGTGAENSATLLMSEHQSATENAITVTGNNNSMILVGRRGTVMVENTTNTFDRLIGKRIFLRNNNTITVPNNPNFESMDVSSGTTGAYNVVKGSYKINR